MPGQTALQSQHVERSVSARPAVVILVLFTAAAIWLKWGKLDSLLWQDPAWWLNEYARYARGELPYRDFYWPYGPLSADLFAWPMRAFGSTFAVVQTVVDVLSAAVVYLVYRISRQLIPAPLPALTSICLVAVGITARTYFSLFSLIGYTPSVHAGAVGVLLMMDAALAYIADGRRRLVRISLGAWVACLSKQETLAAAVLIFILLALGDRKLWFSGKKKQQWLKVYAIQSLSCFLLPLLLYLAWGEVAGWTKFAACLQGFGLSSLACPWWPNGYGLTGAVVAVAEGGLVFLLGCLCVPDLRRRLSRRPLLASACALVAAAGVVAFEWRIFSDLLSGAGGIGQRIQRDSIEFFSTSSILRPVLWCGYGYGAVLLLRLASRKPVTKARLRNLILIAVPGLMSVRSLFGGILSHTLEVPAIAYPFLLLTGPYLLYSALATASGTETASRSSRTSVIAYCSALLIAYTAIRLVGGYAPLLASKTFPSLATPAGRIGLRMLDVEKPILEYVLQNSTPRDTILELPFGGGMSFATGRNQPTYSTLFIQLRPSKAIQMEDFKRLTARPPAVVIARAGPHLGTLYGIQGNVGCIFPRLEWKGDQPSSDPTYIFPIVNYIEQHYRIGKTIGDWVLLRAN